MNDQSEPDRQESTPKTRDIERFKEWLSFWKFVLGTFILGLAANGINLYVQDREVKIKEMALLGNYVEQAINENYTVQKRFAEYFATMTTSGDLKNRWEQYEAKIDERIAEEESLIAASQAEEDSLRAELAHLDQLATDLSAQLKESRGMTGGEGFTGGTSGDPGPDVEQSVKQFNETMQRRSEAERDLALLGSKINASQAELTYQRKPTTVLSMAKSGWIKIGQYDGRQDRWISANFSVGRNTSPDQLKGQDITSVAEKIVVLPEIPSGRAIRQKPLGFIPRGTSLHVIQMGKGPIAEDVWARVSYFAPTGD